MRIACLEEHIVTPRIIAVGEILPLPRKQVTKMVDSGLFRFLAVKRIAGPHVVYPPLLSRHDTPLPHTLAFADQPDAAGKQHFYRVQYFASYRNNYSSIYL